jgi:hypothetical protein
MLVKRKHRKKVTRGCKMNTVPEMPVAANLPAPPTDREKEVMMKAAAIYDRAEIEKQKMLGLIEGQKIDLGIMRNSLLTMEQSIAEKDNRYAVLEAAYREVLQDKADLAAILSNIHSDLEHYVGRLAGFKLDRFKLNGASIPDPLAELAEAVAE